MHADPIDMNHTQGNIITFKIFARSFSNCYKSDERTNQVLLPLGRRKVDKD